MSALGPAFDAALDRGLEALAVEVDPAARERLARYAARLLAWNAKVNLTSITDPAEVAEKHLVDALGLLRTLGPARTVLDLGSGAGIPGAVLACARPSLEVTCVDAVAKKVAFVKAVAAELDLPVRARAARAEGRPDGEGLPRCDAVVSRALGDPTRWVPLGKHYLSDGGVLFAMLGREHDQASLGAIGALEGLRLLGVDRFTLPLSGAQRAVARWARE